MLQKSVSEILLRWFRGRKKDSRKRKGDISFRSWALQGHILDPASNTSMAVHLLLLEERVSKDLTATVQFSNQILHIIQARVVNIFPGNPKSYSKFGSNHQNWDLNSANLITSEKTFKRSVKALYARSLCIECVVNQNSSGSILTYNLSKQHQKLPIWRLPKHLPFFPNLSPPCSNQ